MDGRREGRRDEQEGEMKRKEEERREERKRKKRRKESDIRIYANKERQPLHTNIREHQRTERDMYKDILSSFIFLSVFLLPPSHLDPKVAPLRHAAPFQLRRAVQRRHLHAHRSVRPYCYVLL
jgi:hypothetical protein